MLRNSTNKASAFTILIAALLFSVSLAGIAAAEIVWVDMFPRGPAWRRVVVIGMRG